MGHRTPEPDEPVVIDCDECAVRGPGCRDCVVSVLLGVPDTLLEDERAALEVLAGRGWRRGCGWYRSAGTAVRGWQVRLRTGPRNGASGG